MDLDVLDHSDLLVNQEYDLRSCVVGGIRLGSRIADVPRSCFKNITNAPAVRDDICAFSQERDGIYYSFHRRLTTDEVIDSLLDGDAVIKLISATGQHRRLGQVSITVKKGLITGFKVEPDIQSSPFSKISDRKSLVARFGQPETVTPRPDFWDEQDDIERLSYVRSIPFSFDFAVFGGKLLAVQIGEWSDNFKDPFRHQLPRDERHRLIESFATSGPGCPKCRSENITHCMTCAIKPYLAHLLAHQQAGHLEDEVSPVTIRRLLNCEIWQAVFITNVWTGSQWQSG